MHFCWCYVGYIGIWSFTDVLGGPIDLKFHFCLTLLRAHQQNSISCLAGLVIISQASSMVLLSSDWWPGKSKENLLKLTGTGPKCCIDRGSGNSSGKASSNLSIHHEKIVGTREVWETWMGKNLLRMWHGLGEWPHMGSFWLSLTNIPEILQIIL